MNNLKEELLKNLGVIEKELVKGHDVTIKMTKKGVKILSAKIKNVTA